MKSESLLWLLGLAVIGLVGGAGGIAVLNAMWKQQGQGPKWLPALNDAEQRYGIPTDLLARMAYQESHFRPDIISGATVSPAGALGLMQLMPQYFPSVTVPQPFTDDDTLAQIDAAAAELARLEAHFGNWEQAVAAYNWGQGNVDKHWPSLPSETATYVAQVFGDVPAAASA
jgi:soluble lytic murein transglycosylase-like protein